MPTDTDWPINLCSPESNRQTQAVSELREILAKSLRIAFQDRLDVSHAHIEDFTQDSLIRILDRIEDFKGKSKFTTWAQSIALNTAFTELRRKRWKDVSLDAITEKNAHFTPPEMIAESTPGENEESHHLATTLQTIIATHLTQKQRIAISAKLQELPMDQICNLLEVNRNTGYKILHDARLALKKHLQEYGVNATVIQTAFSS